VLRQHWGRRPQRRSRLGRGGGRRKALGARRRIGGRCGGESCRGRSVGQCRRRAREAWPVGQCRAPRLACGDAELASTTLGGRSGPPCGEFERLTGKSRGARAGRLVDHHWPARRRPVWPILDSSRQRRSDHVAGQPVGVGGEPGRRVVGARATRVRQPVLWGVPPCCVGLELRPC
jgi:hypothetical protein